jgi:hypothetical protein
MRKLGKIQKIVLNISLGLSLLFSIVLFKSCIDSRFKNLHNNEEIIMCVFSISFIYFLTIGLYFNHWSICLMCIIFLIIFIIRLTTLKDGGFFSFFDGHHYRYHYWSNEDWLRIIISLFCLLILCLELFIFLMTISIKSLLNIYQLPICLSINCLIVLFLCLLQWIKLHMFQKLYANNWIILGLLIIWIISTFGCLIGITNPSI